MDYLDLLLPLLPLLLSMGLATYIIPRILVVSVKKDLVIRFSYNEKRKIARPTSWWCFTFSYFGHQSGCNGCCLIDVQQNVGD